jgi:hypothetical protein
MKMYCLNVRNFTNTSLRKTLSRLKYLNFAHVESFKRFWCALKFIVLLEPTLKELCYVLLRNGWDLDFQLDYSKALDVASETNDLSDSLFGFGFRDRQSARVESLIKLLQKIPTEMWIPLTVFPRFEYQKDPRMYLAFEPVNYLHKAEEFQTLVRNYLRTLDVPSLFIPPPDITMKVSSSRYNDGGVVRRDYERPEISFESGFLYQSFNPKPLATREVWLPDKSTKLNNNFWMIIGRQLLKASPVYPKEDAWDTWQLIKNRLDYFGYFDISGFGFQYPREWLQIVAQEVVNLYPNPDIFEQLDIFKKLCLNLKVNMGDGTFKYPPRGIGLGYYEDLKTIGMLAILDQYNPISVYGDQGLLDQKVTKQAIDSLREFGFIIKAGKWENKLGMVKWGGWSMTPRSLERPKQIFEPLISLFHAEYHWERKLILKNFYQEFSNYYDEKDQIIPFQYEMFFGHEFTRADSLWNFKNSGVSSLRLEVIGNIRSTIVQNLHSPADSITDSSLYETPFFTEWKRADAKKFSIKRKNLYREGGLKSTFLYYYVNPRIRLHKTKKPNLTRLASCVSDFTESKLVVNHGVTTGKFLYGLTGEGVMNALRFCIRARNPYEAYATGGYSVETHWRADPVIPSEHLFLAEHFLTNVTQMSKFIATRFDIPNFDVSNIFPHLKRSLLDESNKDSESFVSQNDTDGNKRQYKTISFADMVNNTNYEAPIDSSMSEKVTNLISDIKFRSTNLVEVDSFVEDEIDEDLFLGEFDPGEESD